MAFFQMFSTSKMARALVKFALSKVDLLDTDALQIDDNLNLEFSRQSVLEFRDVGLRVDKLAVLLNLPPPFAIQRAKVQVLKVTVPIDIYSTPIRIEVENVQVGVLLADRSGRSRPNTPHYTSATTGESMVLPDTADLAQSFLQTQSRDERRELEEAALASQRAATAGADDDTDEESQTGFGQPLSLPAFMTGFLQGIVDRVQIKINRVEFQMDVEVASLAGGVEVVSVQLAVDGIDVQGVTVPGTAAKGGNAGFEPREGKRHVGLHNVRAFLLTEAGTLNNLEDKSSQDQDSRGDSPRRTNELDVDSQRGIETYPKQMSSSAVSGDSEAALGIPYDLEEGADDDDAPETPRVSQQQQADDYSFPQISQSVGNLQSGDLVQLAQSEDLMQFSYHQSNTQSDLAQLSQSQYGGQLSQYGDDFRDAEASDDDDDLEISRYEDASPLPFAAPEEFASPVSERAFPASPGESVGGEYFKEAVSEMAEEPTVSQLGSFDVSQPTVSQLGTPYVESQQSMISQLGLSHVNSQVESPPESFIESFQQQTLSSPPLVSSVLATHLASFSASPRLTPSIPQKDDSPTPDEPSQPSSQSSTDDAEDSEDLTQSRVFTHEEAESMYMSAFSHTRRSRRSRYLSMPGAWGMDSDMDSSAVSEASEGDSPWVAPPPQQTNPPEHVKEEVSRYHVRELLALSFVSIFVPSQHKQADPPEALSIHEDVYASTVIDGPSAAPPKATADTSNSVEVKLSPLGIWVDTSLVMVLTAVVGRLMEVGNTNKSTPTTDNPKVVDSAGVFSLNVDVAGISLVLVDKVLGSVRTSTRGFSEKEYAPEQTRLQAKLDQIQISRKQSPTSAQTVIKIKTVAFGYADAPIVAFNRDIKMTGSYAEMPAEYDVQMQLTQLANGSTKITGQTLPLAITLDLKRVGEAVGWVDEFCALGGSNVTAAPPPPPPPPPPPETHKIRRVSFNTPERHKEPSAATNIRIGGAEVKVVGSQAGISLRSGTVKLALTQSMMGAHISQLEISGPHSHSHPTTPPVKIWLQDARARFFSKPRDQDMDRLLRIVAPSDKAFGSDDELMVDPLLVQRSRGSLLTVEVGRVGVSVGRVGRLVDSMESLGGELGEVAEVVARYLPDDDRPGMLLLAGVEMMSVAVDFKGTQEIQEDVPESLQRLGALRIEVQNVEVAHVGLPLLAAARVSELTVTRNDSDRFIDTARLPPNVVGETVENLPVLMVRMLDDQMEPVVKVRLQEVEFEYRVPVVIELLGLQEGATREEYEAELMKSVAHLGEQTIALVAEGKSKQSKISTALDLQLHNCLIGMNPLNEPSKMVAVIEQAHFRAVAPEHDSFQLDAKLGRSWLLLVNDAKADVGVQSPSRIKQAMDVSRHMGVYCAAGFVNVCEIRSVAVEVKTRGEQMDVAVRDVFVLLETCADSTHTLLQLAGALAPPSPPSKERQYRTEIVPLKNVLASITEDAFGMAEGDYEFDADFGIAQQLDTNNDEDDEGDYNDSSPFMFNSQYYPDEGERLFDANVLSDASEGDSQRASQQSSESDLDFANSYYDLADDGDRPRIWDSKRSRYSTAPAELLAKSPLRLAVHDAKIIWDLHDGYDWAHTRDVVGAAIRRAEAAAQERRERRETHPDPARDEDVVGDCLFNSVYIHIPTTTTGGYAGGDVTAEINHGVNMSETASVTVSVPSTATTTRRGAHHHRGSSSSAPAKKLRLGRSSTHKVKIELMDMSADVTILPPGSGETLVTTKFKVGMAEVYDNLPTSTWKKFLTYDWDAGPREYGKKMVKAEVLAVKPHADLAASELVVSVEVLPLRLHVDQDALDFIIRFFSFSEDEGEKDEPSHPFFQRTDIRAIPVRLDFKPKRVNYASLRSGSTTELMNFLILDNSRMVLERAIVFGQPGPVRLGETLKSIWMPEITRNQLPGVLAGLSAVRPFADVGSGFKELVVSYNEYRDGRGVRGISKGAFRFAKRTGTELVRMGAKLAVGTQNALEGAEALLSPPQPAPSDDDSSEPHRAPISKYAAAPHTISSGLRMGYNALRHDLGVAKNAAVAVPVEMMESGSAKGAVRALLGRSQTVILRPGIAVSKAIGQTLLGAANSIDPENIRRADDKYKHY